MKSWPALRRWLESTGLSPIDVKNIILKEEKDFKLWEKIMADHPDLKEQP